MEQTKDNKYQATVIRNNHGLKIELCYPAIVTEAEEKIIKGLKQRVSSKRASCQVSKDKISVTPKKGEVVQRKMVFSASENKPLYIGLHEVPHEALDFLIKELKKENSDLAQYTIRELKKIINK